jgi:hypothetical protein
MTFTSTPLSSTPLLSAATALGYDQKEWDRHRSAPLSLPPDNLVLGMENYLEGEAYFSTYFWTQIICSLVVVSVSLIEIRHIFVWIECERRVLCSCTLTKMEIFVLITSGFAVIFSYVLIPVLIIMASLLLILESGSVIDMIKDTLSLLFLNEINNYLQIRNAPGAQKWTIKLTQDRYSEMTRAKSFFTMLLFIGFGFLAWAASEQVYSGRWGCYHPSLLFNTLRQRQVPEGQVAWILYLCTVGFVGFIFFVTFLVRKFGEEALLYLERETQGFVYRKPETQGFVSDSFNPLDDIDELWYGSEPQEVSPPPTPPDPEDPVSDHYLNLQMFSFNVADYSLNLQQFNVADYS